MTISSRSNVLLYEINKQNILLKMINVVFTGHIDHGKSTLIGRIFHEYGVLSTKIMDRLGRHAKALGKFSSRFAFFTDTRLDERERGISIDLSFKSLETPKNKLTIIDAPGHTKYTKNLISGIAAADASVLVIDTKETVSKGLAPQTVEHLILLKALGIESLIVAVNKIDTVDYDQDFYEHCKLEIEKFCNKIRYDTGTIISFVPVSAIDGDNVLKLSEKTSWYKGPSLMDSMDSIGIPAFNTNFPLRMPILRTFNVRGVGTVLSGKIEMGQVKSGDQVAIVPYPGSVATRVKVKSIQRQSRKIDSASLGDYVGVLITKQEKGFMARMVKKGAILCSFSSQPHIAGNFIAEVEVVDHPAGISVGYTPYIHVHQAAMPCRITKILSINNIPTIKDNVEQKVKINKGDTAIVRIKPLKPLVIEPVLEIPRLGKFALRDGRTVAVGKCLRINQG